MLMIARPIRRFRGLLALIVLALGGDIFAAKIEGTITFDGSVTLNTTSVTTATRATSWTNAKVEDASGDFGTYAASGDAVAIHAPWYFNTVSPVPNFWQVGGFTFELHSSEILFQGYGFLSVWGSGMIYGNGFTPTAGTWNFTTQNPAARSRFSFSSGVEALPDSAATFGLLVLSLAGVVAASRLYDRKRACRQPLQ